MTKGIEEKVREQARQWFISSDMNVKDFALSVAKYVYEITTATPPADVQERAKELAQWVIDNRYPKSENNKVSDLEMFHHIVDNLAGASSLQAENERLREANSQLLQELGRIKHVTKCEWTRNKAEEIIALTKQ